MAYPKEAERLPQASSAAAASQASQASKAPEAADATAPAQATGASGLRLLLARLTMAKVRKIERRPQTGRNYYLVDANFLARKHIPTKLVPAGLERDRVEACQAWWAEIDAQLKSGHARVYIPDICVAEAFKVFASWYYVQKWFKTSLDLKKVRDKLSSEIRTDTKALRTTFRPVRYHDISTNRDIIISVDRFFETFMKHGKRCSVPDLIIAATAKYLREFYDIPRDTLHIVTLDRALREGIAKIPELPSAYDPTLATHAAARVFETVSSAPAV